ncbi:MAG: hypothetical protein AB7Y46_20660 [Armatimonadota bacterium]
MLVVTRLPIRGLLLAAASLVLGMLDASIAIAEEAPVLAGVSIAGPQADAMIEERLLALGPEALPTIERLNLITRTILEMHAAITASPDDVAAGDARLHLRRAMDAVEYFADRNAVGYLLLGLGSADVQVHVPTSRAIAGLEATVKEQHRAMLIAGIVDALAHWPTLYGSEWATLDSERRFPLWGVLSDLLSLEVQRGRRGYINNAEGRKIEAAARRWLAEQSKPPASQGPAPADQ